MSKQIELIPEFNNFRDILENSVKSYRDNIAYKYKFIHMYRINGFLHKTFSF